jgi:hypothetical protein
MIVCSVPRILFLYTPHVGACAAIAYAAVKLNIVLPEKWWNLFDIDTHVLMLCIVDIEKIYQLLSDKEKIIYTPPDPAEQSELTVYKPANRQQLLLERKKQIESNEVQSTVAPVASSPSSSST